MTSGAYTPRLADFEWKQLESIVSAADISIAGQEDAVDGVIPLRVIHPRTEEQVSEILKWANAAGAKICVRGGGSKSGWGNVPTGVDLVLSTEKLSGIIEHVWQDMTVTVRAGTAMQSLQETLAHKRQRLALDALWPRQATVGGVIATNDNGSLRLRFGSMRDLILGITIVLPNGTIARSGGKVVKNVAGYDLPKLLTGSLGTLGVITEATFRAHPLPATVRTLTFNCADVAEANKLMLAISDSTLVPAGMQLRADHHAKVDVRFEGVEEGISAQVDTAKRVAGSATCVESSTAVWEQRETLWTENALAIMGKFSVLPTAIAVAVQAIREKLGSTHIVVQATGLGLFATACNSIEGTEAGVRTIDRAIREIAGTVTWLQLPLELKKKLDVFGPLPDSYPLMVRVKQKFDPNGILNPGRFVGGI